VFILSGLPELGAMMAILTGGGLSLLAKRFGWVLPTEVRIPRPRWRTTKRQRPSSER
jgi:hypothetical protein